MRRRGCRAEGGGGCRAEGGEAEGLRAALRLPAAVGETATLPGHQYRRVNERGLVTARLLIRRKDDPVR